MAPSALPPPSPVRPQREQDVDLTGSAIQHKIADTSSTNGIIKPTNYSNGHVNGYANGHDLGSQDLDASKLIYHYTTSRRTVPDQAMANAARETICTDHMITATWSAESGWAAPELRPFGPLSLMPTASVLHYATECFEGLKAYRGFDGKLRLFRPACNASRFLTSAVRISLPGFQPVQIERLLLALMAVDGPKWLPRDRPGSHLYLRPALIGTHAQLGVQTPREAMLFITASYMPCMDSPPAGLRLHTSPEDMVRAWVGGFGFAKVGANYGPSLLATQEARSRGFGQILWLYGPQSYCTEAGASNFFVLWRSRPADGGRLQLVTAPLDDRLILDGITRRSVVQLARERLVEELDVVERRYTIDEVLEAYREGRLVEAFAAGTAYFVCPVSLIHHRGTDVDIPLNKGQPGHYTSQIKQWLKDIMYGREKHEWGVVVQEQTERDYVTI